MGSTYTYNAATFLVHTLFGLYITIVLLRFLLQIVRADFYNPVSQFVVQATNPILKHLRRFIPGYGGIDMSAVALMLVLQMVELYIIITIKGADAGALGILVLAIAELLALTLTVFFFSILIQVILSWVNPSGYNPIAALLYTLNEPILGPARRIIPPLGGLDLSPIVVIIALRLAEFLIIHPIRDAARALL
jgi:YggT family protein